MQVSKIKAVGCTHGFFEGELGGCPLCVADAKAREQAVKDAGYELQQKAAREDEVARRKPIYDAIAAAVVAAGHVVENVGTNAFKIDGVGMGWLLTLKVRYESGRYSFSKKATDKFSVVVGDFGNMKSYPPKKDGSHSYDKIAQVLITRAAAKVITLKIRETVSNNEGVVMAFRTAVGIKQYYGPVYVEASKDVAKPIQLTFKIDAAMTETKAMEVIEALRSIGLVPS